MEKKQGLAAKTAGESFSPVCSAGSPGQERKQGVRALCPGWGWAVSPRTPGSEEG